MPKLKTIKCYPFEEVTDEVEKLLGYSTRNVRNGNHSAATPTQYWDWWHKFLELYESQIHNPCLVRWVDFNDMKEYFAEKEPDNSEWISEVCDAYLKVMEGCETSTPDDDTYDFWIEW